MISPRLFELLLLSGLCASALMACSDDPKPSAPSTIQEEDASPQPDMPSPEPDADPEPTPEPDVPDVGPMDVADDIEEPDDVPDAEPEPQPDVVEDAPDAEPDANPEPMPDVMPDADPEPEPEPDPPVVVRGLDGRCEGEQPVMNSPDETCDAPDPNNLGAFARCPAGSGVFGQWGADDSGLPTYDYTLAQAVDDRAQWTRSDGSVRRDHWFSIGNDRYIATASNDGFVQLLTRERGPTWTNAVDLARDRTGGGYSYIVEDDGQVWSTAYRLRPCGPVQTVRRFGVAQVVYETTFRGLQVRHTLYAPTGDGAFLIDEVTLTNTRDTPRELRHYEFWDVNRHALEFQLGRSGLGNPDALDQLDDLRRNAREIFEVTAATEPQSGAATISHTYIGNQPAPARDVPSARNYYPAPITLARLQPAPDEVPLRAHTDREAFFGQGDSRQPDAVILGADPVVLAPSSATGQPAVLVDEVSLTLEPGESRTLRYAYGTLPEGVALDDLDGLRAPARDLEVERRNEWNRTLPRVDAAGVPWMHRELAWHSAALIQAAVQEDYFRAKTITQGSAYLFEHGFDGAARDFSLAGIPLAYIRPDLAREALRSTMRMTRPSGQISYIVQGFGLLEDAFVHNAPSDLDLHFLWALVEYIAATGDGAFLNDPNPFYPRNREPNATTLDHARRALIHLIDTIGTGPNGLVRMRTGDWNDLIVSLASNRPRALEQGESMFNTQMALWVVPRAAALVEDSDPELAARARVWAEGLRAPLAEQWLGSWFRRAWLGPNEPFGDDFIQLDGQVWAMVAEADSPERLATLRDSVHTLLDEPSPSGALYVEDDMTWHVLAALLTWGYSRTDADLAWAHFAEHSMATYAQNNPNQWFGIWAGPDALFPGGGTWATEVSAMVDHPVMNSQQHAMPLLAALRLAGIEPREEGDGLIIDPPTFERSLSMQWPILDLTIAPGVVRGTYKALTDGVTVLQVRVPAPGSIATFNGMPVVLPDDVEFAYFPMSFVEGDSLDFSVIAP